jgi:hypothetical protein
VNAHVGYTYLAKKLRDAHHRRRRWRHDRRRTSRATTTTRSASPTTCRRSWVRASRAAAYVGANKKDFYGDINKGRVILTLSKAM